VFGDDPRGTIAAPDAFDQAWPRFERKAEVANERIDPVSG
jgi:hypothetical protein